MTKQQLLNLKTGDILMNNLSNKSFKVYENITYGTYLLINQPELIFEYINPCNCAAYTFARNELQTNA